MFKEAAARMKPHPTVRAVADEQWRLDPRELIYNRDLRRQTFLRYLKARRQGKQVDIRFEPLR